MSFRYILRPNQSKPDNTSTRADLGVPVEDAEYFAKVADLSGKPVAECEAIFDALLAAFVAFGRETRSTVHLKNKLRMQPTSGGSFPVGSTPHTAQDIGAHLNFIAGPDLIAAFEASLSITCTGEEGVRAPIIDRVVDNRTGMADHYTAGDVLEMTGDNLTLDPADTAQGVFLTTATGTVTRVTRYISMAKTSMSVMVPSTVTGVVGLSVASKYDTATLRTGHYPTNLSP